MDFAKNSTFKPDLWGRLIGLPVLMLMIFQLNVSKASAQSSLDIYLSPGIAGGPVTFERIDLAGGANAIDTFTGRTDNYYLKLPNVSAPQSGILRVGNRKLREIFLAPGFPLIVTINTGQRLSPRWDSTAASIPIQAGSASVSIQEKCTGPWSVIDSIYKTVQVVVLNSFDEVIGAKSRERARLYDGLLKKIDTGSAGLYRPVKDYLLFIVMSKAIGSSAEIRELNDYQVLHQPFLNQLAYGALRNVIDKEYQSKLKQMVLAQQGKAAPVFTLKDSSGRSYSLKDYKGKVVYLDLWASWCLPCRLETPYMHRLINRYTHRNDIVFIGVAVSDKVQDWKRALKQDKPAWLQLHDNNTFVANAYAARSIPRYVLIDKAGNVVDFYAPAPSEPAKLVELIDRELGN